MSFSYDRQLYNTNSAEEILPYLMSVYKAGSMIDVGCGLGTWLSVAHNLGVGKIFGIDASDYDAGTFVIAQENYQKIDLLQEVQIGQNFDLCICLEVAEHLEVQMAEKFIELICSLAPVILFSAAIPGQPGQGHVNCQWPDYWQHRFKKHGFEAYDILRAKYWRNARVEWWYKQNMVVYAKPGMIRNHLPMESEIPEYVHPELYKLKMQEIEDLHQVKVKTIFNPSIPFAMRSLIKSVIVTPWKKHDKI